METGSEPHTLAPTGAGRCPVDHHFSMMDDAFAADPYRHFAAVRENPVFYAEALGFYVVTRYRDVEAVLTDPVRFSNSNVFEPVTPLTANAKAILGEGSIHRRPNLSNADGERHEKVRAYVNQVLRPRRLREMEPHIYEWVRPRVEKMIGRGEVDFSVELAFPLPAFVGLSLIGFPAKDHERIKLWSRDRVVLTHGRPKPGSELDIARRISDFWQYTCDFAHRRLQEEPADDLTGDLVRYHQEKPEEFTEGDLATVIYELAVASHETTTFQLTSAVKQLLTNRDQWQAVIDDPSLIPGAIEESIRIEGSIIGWRRRAVEPVEIGGVQIPANATLLLLFGSANHDPEKFENPEKFDIRRTTARQHLTFGKGIHFCAGAPLARLEIKVALELMAELAPEVTLRPEQDYRVIPNIAQRGATRLMLDFSACKAPVPA